MNNIICTSQSDVCISVIMPVYNQATFAMRAIKSLIDQTYTNWKLIIIDDCSTDYIADVVEELLPENKYILLKNKENEGVGFCLNRGLDESDDTLIAYLPADDIYYRNHLESLCNTLLNSKSILAYSGILHHYNDNHANNLSNKTKGQIHNSYLQLVQVLHRKTEDRWIERKELVTDDYNRMFWNKLSNKSSFVETECVSCEWVSHPMQRHKIINEKYGGNIFLYKRYFNIKYPINFHSSYGNVINEKSFSLVSTRKKNNEKSLKILIIGELGYNPERLIALEDRGHKLYGIWINNPASYNSVGPFPYCNVEEIKSNQIEELSIDIIYALLNYQAVPLAHHILKNNQNIPFVWHFKEGPFYCRQYGMWHQLMELYAFSDGQIYCNSETKEWITNFIPQDDNDTSYIMDGDLPKKEWFTNVRTELISKNKDEYHTIIPGRPVGLNPTDIGELAKQKIHLHFYGNIQQNIWNDWTRQAFNVAPKYLHLHANCDQKDWVKEFSKYDAGWLHYFESDNNGELSKLKWNDMNHPARIATYAMCGLPMIQKNNLGHTVATQNLTKKMDLGIFINNLSELREHLKDNNRMNEIRENVWRSRFNFCFDNHADDLINFFHKIIEIKKNNLK